MEVLERAGSRIPGNNGLTYGAAIPIQATATATAFAEAATYQAAVAAVATLAAGALTSDVSRVSVAGGGSADTTHSVRRERCRENLPEIIWGDSSCASCDDVSAVNNINNNTIICAVLCTPFTPLALVFIDNKHY